MRDGETACSGPRDTNDSSSHKQSGVFPTPQRIRRKKTLRDDKRHLAVTRQTFGSDKRAIWQCSPSAGGLVRSR